MDFYPLLKNMSKNIGKKKLAVNTAKNVLICNKIYYRCNSNCFKKSNSKNNRTGDFIENKIADKITMLSRTLAQNTSETVTNEIENMEFDRVIPKEISRKKAANY